MMKHKCNTGTTNLKVNLKHNNPTSRIQPYSSTEACSRQLKISVNSVSLLQYTDYITWWVKCSSENISESLNKQCRLMSIMKLIFLIL